MSEALGLPVLNLSRGGVGPELFLDERLLQLLRGARFVVLQVMSGRSAGCPDYPGDKMVELGDGRRVDRRDILKQLWDEDRETAIHYVRRWNLTYLDAYRKLRERIGRPIMLLWFSERAAADWNPAVLEKRFSWGSFPQLVGAEVYARLRDLFEERHEAVTGETREATVSRVSGEPCPYFGDHGTDLPYENTYYPTSSSHAAVAGALLPWASEALARGQPRMSPGRAGRASQPAGVVSALKKDRTAKPAKLDHAEKGRVATLGRRVAELAEREGRIPALRRALAVSGKLLAEPSDPLRFDLRRKVFGPLLRTGMVSYQANDFECFDYELFDIAADLPTFRGPSPSPAALQQGEYFCVIGAAQTFGRLVGETYGRQLSELLALPVLNLGRGGVGPELFLDERLLRLIAGARIRHRSGYVRTQRRLSRISRREDRRVAKWRAGRASHDPATIVGRGSRQRHPLCPSLERHLSGRLSPAARGDQAAGHAAVVLGARAGRMGSQAAEGAFHLARFPQLIGREVHDQLIEVFGDHHEAVTGKTSEPVFSRITGEPAAYFGDNGSHLHHHNTYYPTSASHAAVAHVLLPWARDALARG